MTGYEVRVEADQAERPPQVFTAVRIHHVVTGLEIDVAALEEAIRLSEEKYCSVGAMVQKTASFHTTYEIVEEKTEWMKPAPAAGVQSVNAAFKRAWERCRPMVDLASGLGAAGGSANDSYAAAGRQYRAGEEPAAQGSARRHQG